MEGITAQAGPEWLTVDEQEAWIAASRMFLRLPAALDAQLQRDSGLSLFEYFVLSRLSMAPGRTLRMSELAELANGSLSRLSNVVKRLEQREWLRREPDPDDGRYTVAILSRSGLAQVEAAAPGHVGAVRTALFDLLTPAQVASLAEIGTAVTEQLRANPGCASGSPGVCLASTGNP